MYLYGIKVKSINKYKLVSIKDKESKENFCVFYLFFHFSS